MVAQRLLPADGLRQLTTTAASVRRQQGMCVDGGGSVGSSLRPWHDWERSCPSDHSTVLEPALLQLEPVRVHRHRSPPH